MLKELFLKSYQKLIVYAEALLRQDVLILIVFEKNLE